MAVNNIGIWTEEKDYTNYPTEKWCDYDIMAYLIRSTGYEPKTTMENLITMAMLHGESEAEALEINYDDYTCDDIHKWVLESGGYAEFDYWC